MLLSRNKREGRYVAKVKGKYYRAAVEKMPMFENGEDECVKCQSWGTRAATTYAYTTYDWHNGPDNYAEGITICRNCGHKEYWTN